MKLLLQAWLFPDFNTIPDSCVRVGWLVALGKKSRLNRGSNSQQPGNESDTLTTEPPGRGLRSR